MKSVVAAGALALAFCQHSEAMTVEEYAKGIVDDPEYTMGYVIDYYFQSLKNNAPDKFKDLKEGKYNGKSDVHKIADIIVDDIVAKKYDLQVENIINDFVNKLTP